MNNKKKEDFIGFHKGAVWQNGAEFLLRPKTLKRDDVCAIRALECWSRSCEAVVFVLKKNC